MRNMIAVTMAAALMALPVKAQQHGHGQTADSTQGMMGMMRGQPGMMQGHCGMSPGGMMRGMMGEGMMQAGMMQGGMMQAGMMGMAGGPGMMLSLKETLGLTEGQVEPLQAMKGSADSEVHQHLMQGMEARQAATEILQSESPDLDTYEEKLREAANHMVLAHTVMARFHLQARDELTEEQRQILETSRGMMMELCKGSHGGGMMPHGGQPGSGERR